MPTNSFQLSPANAEARYQSLQFRLRFDPKSDDPLFRPIDADDFRIHGASASDFTTLRRNGLIRGFTKRYNVKRLVYFEEHATAPLAIQREKNIKHWPREWKIDLILSINPDWRDLYDDITQ